MKIFPLKLKTYLALFFSVLILCSCDSNDKPEIIPDEPDINIGDSRTVLVYMMANNNLESLLDNNIEDMVEGLNRISIDKADKCNFFVYFQGRGSQTSPVLYKIESFRKGADKVLIKTFSKQSSVDPARVKEVIDYVFTNYPAGSEGLIFSSHADGWLPASTPRTRWIGQDGSDYLDLLDLKKAMSRFEGNPLDFILFDCCFMQSVEVAYEFRNYTKFTIGSATETPGPGGPYNRLMKEFYSEKQGKSLAIGIADTYFKPYQNGEVTNGWKEEYGVSMGVVETSKLDKLNDITLAALKELDIPKLDNTNVFYYDQSRQHYYYDFYRLMEHNVSPAAFSTWKEAFTDAMVYYETTPNNYSAYIEDIYPMGSSKGMAMYTPVEGNNTPSSPDVIEYYKQLNWYKDVMGKVFHY